MLSAHRDFQVRSYTTRIRIPRRSRKEPRGERETSFHTYCRLGSESLFRLWLAPTMTQPYLCWVCSPPIYSIWMPTTPACVVATVRMLEKSVDCLDYCLQYHVV